MGSASGAEEVKQDGDGQFVRYLPAPLLKEVNIVDTPGTNVILQRQQRLTEEYVPRADLVLFTMSAGLAPTSTPCVRIMLRLLCVMRPPCLLR